MIKLVSDTINRSDIESLIEWLQQDPIPRLTKGELTWKLEEKWAKKINTKYSVFVNSGSSSILLTLAALKQLNRLKNDKIIVPSLSWATDVSSPMLLGLTPIMCDCNLEDLSCDLDHLEKLFKEHNPGALILVSPLGLVPKMKAVIELQKVDKVNIQVQLSPVQSKKATKLTEVLRSLHSTVNVGENLQRKMLVMGHILSFIAQGNLEFVVCL